MQDYIEAIQVIMEELKLEVANVVDAVTNMRDQLTQLESLLEGKNYDGASDMGYREISVAFIDIQRCLGAMQSCCADEQQVVACLAEERSCSEQEARQLLTMKPAITNQN